MTENKTRVWTDFATPFTPENGETGVEFVECKRAVVAKYGSDGIKKSWIEVCRELEKITDEIASKKTLVIPEIEYSEFAGLSAEGKQEMRDAGCFVVRGVIDKEVADGWFKDLKGYIADNKNDVSGWPLDTPMLYRLFATPTQIKARSHPHQLAVARELNSWWTSSTPDTSEPLSYMDALRIRSPGVPFFNLGPHIDAGSLSRWVDPTYRDVYSAIWTGQPSMHNPYDLTKRENANQAFFDGAAHSRVLRAFQGWTALTDAGPKEGSLLVYPNLKTTIAYVLLRPFFDPPTDNSKIMDPEAWTFSTETPWFPGTFKEDSQRLSPSTHPHLRLEECLVDIPYIRAGDTVWWHADMIHAVDVEHLGEKESSVVYIAATPSTETNKKYIKQQLVNFLNGEPPVDFAEKKGEGKLEGTYVGYEGEKAILGGEAGRRAMGFAL